MKYTGGRSREGLLRLQVGLVALGLATACSRQFTVPAPKPPPPVQTPPPAPVIPPPLAVQVLPAQVAPDGGAALEVSGGVPPYAVTFVDDARSTPSGPTRAVSLDAGYHAGFIGNSLDVLGFTDSADAGLLVAVQVGPPLNLVPPSAAIPPLGTIAFAAMGGQPPYQFAVACTDGGGSCSPSTISPTGEYQAGTCCENGQDQVSVEDQNGITARSTLSIGPGVTLLPAQVQVNPGGSVTFSVVGGTPPYRFAWARHGNPSGGTITAGGIYQAGRNPGTHDEVQVTDGSGLSSTAQVQVGDPEVDLSSLDGALLYAGDFNGDHYTDVIALSAVDGSVGTPQFGAIIALGGQYGWFATTSLSFPYPVCSAAAGDFNGDGFDDLAVVFDPTNDGTCGGPITVFLGQPSGDLVPGINLDALAGNYLGPLAAVDLRPQNGPLALAMPTQLPNFDIVLDLFDLSQPLGDAGVPELIGQLQPLGPNLLGNIFTGANPQIAVTAHAQGDAGPSLLLYYDELGGVREDCGDVISSDPGTEGVAVLIPSLVKNAKGKWVASSASVAPLLNHGCGQVVTGLVDFAGDGGLAWYLAETQSATGKTVYVQPQAPDGGWAPMITQTQVAEITFALSRPTLTGSHSPEELDLGLPGPGLRLVLVDGGLQSLPLPALPQDLVEAVAGDFNFDSYPDLTVEDFTAHLRRMAGTFGGALSVPTNTFIAAPAGDEVMAGDLDGDGLTDIVVSRGGVLSILSAVGDGSFSLDYPGLFPNLQMVRMAETSSEGWAFAVDRQNEVWFVSFGYGFDGGVGEQVPIGLDGGLPFVGMPTGLFATREPGTLLMAGEVLANNQICDATAALLSTDGGEASIAIAFDDDAGCNDKVGLYSIAPLELSDAGYPDLFLSTDRWRFEIHLANGGPSGWDVDPASFSPEQLDLAFLGFFVSYPIQTGGPLTQVAAVVGVPDSTTCDGTGFWGVLAMNLSSGAIPKAPWTHNFTNDLCTPLNQMPLAIDADGDGLTDLLVSDPNFKRIWLLKGLGDGGFEPQVLPTSIPAQQLFGGTFTPNGSTWLGILRDDLPGVLLWPSQGGSFNP